MLTALLICAWAAATWILESEPDVASETPEAS